MQDQSRRDCCGMKSAFAGPISRGLSDSENSRRNKRQSLSTKVNKGGRPMPDWVRSGEEKRLIIEGELPMRRPVTSKWPYVRKLHWPGGDSR